MVMKVWKVAENKELVVEAVIDGEKVISVGTNARGIDHLALFPHLEKVVKMKDLQQLAAVQNWIEA